MYHRPGAAAHRVLNELMTHGKLPVLQLWRFTRTSNQSFKTWQAKTLMPMVSEKLISCYDNYMCMHTDGGVQLYYTLESMQPISRAPALKRVRMTNGNTPTLVPARDLPQPYIREGALDFLDCPSVRGNKYVWRDES